MKRYGYMMLLIFILFACNNSAQTEKEYIENLEEKNRILEKELTDLKSTSKIKDPKESKLETDNSKEYFTIGSTEDEVLQVMGDPDRYMSAGPIKMFFYELSTVSFKGGKVDSYDNDDGNLKVKVR